MSCESLVQLLRGNISKNKKIIHDYYLYKDDTLDEKQRLEKLLFATTLNISTLPFYKIKEIVLGFDLSKEEKEAMISQLEVITTILKLNYMNGTNMALDEEQEKVLDKFLRCLHEYVLVRREYNANNNVNIEEVTSINDRYKTLATKLSNPKNTWFINELDTLNILFDNNDLDQEVRREFLVSLIKYNKNIFNYKKGFTKNMEVARYGNIDVREVKSIFKKYNYNFDKLDVKIQNKILEFGVLGKIKEVLCVLYKLNIKIDEESNGYFLMSLVLASDKETIAKTIKFILNKKVPYEKLLKIPSVFISEESDDFEKRRFNRFRILEHSVFEENRPYIVGTAEGFRKNALLLEKYGLTLRNVLDRCPELLVIDSKRLHNNLEMYLEYGFPLEKKKKLIDSALSALTALNFCEIVDQFIEIHPYGVKYLRDNLSCVKTVESPYDVIFYNIYYSIKVEGIERAFRRIISNKKEYLCVQGDINNRFSNSYKGITNDNKREITKTIIPKFKNESKYRDILNKNEYRMIDVDIFDNEFIQKINTFSDQEEPLLYNFEGIRISKIKVLRIFNMLIKNGVVATLDSFLFAVCYNTIISDEDYKRLCSLIEKTVR